MFEQKIECYGELSAKVTRADGRVEDYGILSGRRPVEHNPAIVQPKSWYERLWQKLKSNGQIPAAMGLSAFCAYEIGKHLGSHNLIQLPLLTGLVTTTGANYLATDFGSGQASPRISAMNFHDCGTGGAHGSTATVNAASNATPIVIGTSSAHGFTTNDILLLASVGGNTNANGTWQITVTDSTHFSLIGSVGNSAYTSGGTAQLVNGAGDTALTTAAGTARVTGTQTNPAANQYKTVATISFVSTLSIIEWGLFSASSVGTMWDRRWFNNAGAPATTATGALTVNAIGVNSGDSIAFSYTLTVSAGGS